MRYQIETKDNINFELVDLHTRQIRYLGDFKGAREASIKLSLEHQRKERSGKNET